jgi:hypothetical protein
MIIIPSSRAGIITPRRSLLTGAGGGLNIINRRFTDLFPIGPRSHMKARERWDILDAATGRVVKSMPGPWKDNTILNVGKDMACTNFFINCLLYGHLGTGTTPPAETDTHLENWALSTSVHGAETSYLSISGDVFTLTDSLVFPAQTGDFSFTEFSASVNSSGTANMFNRVVFDDPIVGGAGQQPKVTIELALTLTPHTTAQAYLTDVIGGNTPVAGSTGSARIRAFKISSAINTTCNVLASRTAYNSVSDYGSILEPSYASSARSGIWLSELSALLSATDADSDWDGAAISTKTDCMSLAAYTAGNFYRSKTWTAGLADLNKTGVRSFGLHFCDTGYMNYNYNAFQFLSAVAFDKRNTEGFALNVNFAVDAN